MKRGMTRRDLVLNRTMLDWTTVNNVVSKLPRLTSLHLCGNRYTNLGLDARDVPRLLQLALDDNHLQRWSAARWRLQKLLYS